MLPTYYSIPVGDWMYEQYAPYEGCWDGALEELERVLRLIERHNMTVGSKFKRCAIALYCTFLM